MRPSWLLAVVVSISSPGCLTALTFTRLERPERVAPRTVEAVVTDTAWVHVRAHYADGPSEGWRVRAGGGSSARVEEAGPLPEGYRLSGTSVGRLAPGEDGVFRGGADGGYHVVRDGETVASFYLDRREPAPPWRTATAWALAPLTVSVDVATFWIQAPLAWLLFKNGVIST